MRHKARIGAHVAPADSDSRKLFSLSAEVRWVVEDVFPDSPAQATGLRRGEGLLKAEGHVPNPFLSYNPSCCRQLGEKMDDRNPAGGEIRPARGGRGRSPDRPRLTDRDALRLYGGCEVQSESDSRLVISPVHSGSEASQNKLKPGDVLASFFTKKDLKHVERSDARWSSVKDGEKRTLFLYEMLTATNAL